MHLISSRSPHVTSTDVVWDTGLPVRLDEVHLSVLDARAEYAHRPVRRMPAVGTMYYCGSYPRPPMSSILKAICITNPHITRERYLFLSNPPLSRRRLHKRPTIAATISHDAFRLPSQIDSCLSRLSERK